MSARIASGDPTLAASIVKPVRIVGGAALQALNTPSVGGLPLAVPTDAALSMPGTAPASTAQTQVMPASWPAAINTPRSPATDTLAARTSRPIAPAAQVAAPVAATPLPDGPTSATVGATAPAAQAFAAAIQAADRQDQFAADRGLTDAAVATTAGVQMAPVAAAAGTSADQPSLDMRQPGWPAAMVDHIEKLRDAADAVSTRIRIVPDALGSIDVAVRRHDEGAVQVSLVADRPQTQTMIAEARPELTRLADERGTRLDVSVGGGSTGNTGLFGGNTGERHASAQPQSAQRRAPASSFLSDDTTAPADGRVA